MMARELSPTWGVGDGGVGLKRWWGAERAWEERKCVRRKKKRLCRGMLDGRIGRNSGWNTTMCEIELMRNKTNRIASNKKRIWWGLEMERNREELWLREWGIAETPRGEMEKNGYDMHEREWQGL
jgi:hypothetical protein